MEKETASDIHMGCYYKFWKVFDEIPLPNVKWSNITN